MTKPRVTAVLSLVGLVPALAFTSPGSATGRVAGNGSATTAAAASAANLEEEEGSDFPGPGPHAWGRIVRRAPAPAGENVRVNDNTKAGQLAGCTVQSETSVAGMGSYVYVGYNDAQQCWDAVSPSPAGPISWTGFAVSSDSGKSFEDIGPLQANGSIVDLFGDPVLVMDTVGKNKGTLYVGSLANSEKGSTIAVGTSTDHGKHFEWHDVAPTLTNQSDFQDKEWLAVDNTGGPNDGTVYLTWTNFAAAGTQIVFTKSTNNGKTWSRPITVAKGDYQGSRPVVGPDGELYVVFEEGFGSISVGTGGAAVALQLSESKNGGKSFSPPRKIASLISTGHPQVCLGARTVLNGDIRVNEFPSIAVDTFGSSKPSSPNFNPHRGSIYAAYNARGTETLDEADVFIVKVDPKSKQATQPVKVNDDATATDQFFPELVATGPGEIALTWLDRREDATAPAPAGNRKMALWGAVSTDGGKSFPENFKVSDTNWDPPFTNPNAEPAVAACYAGDYNGLYADSTGRVLASWGDNRDSLLVSGAESLVIPDPNVYFTSFKP